MTSKCKVADKGQIFGAGARAPIRGTLTTVEVAASSMGPLLMGATHDLLGSYNDILTVFAAITAPMIIVTLFATPPKEDDLLERTPEGEFAKAAS